MSVQRVAHAINRMNFEGLGSFSLTSAQTVTTSWVDLGSEIAPKGNSAIGLWIDFTINDSNNFRVRLVGRHTTGGDDFVIPIKSITPSSVLVKPSYHEFDDDSDTKAVLSWDLDRVLPYIQFQVQVGTANTVSSVVNSSFYTPGWL